MLSFRRMGRIVNLDNLYNEIRSLGRQAMEDQTITLLLRLVHILSGIFWAGTAFFNAGFLLPAVQETGPAGGQFVQHLMAKRRVPIYLASAMLLTLISGFVLYGRLVSATNGAWAESRPGMVYGMGGLAALLAGVVGLGLSWSAGRRMAAIGQRITDAGPSPEQQSEIQRLQRRVALGARITAALLLISASAMAVGRYV